MRAVERVSIQARTNSSSINLRGLEESQTTSTNATALFEGVVRAAVGAAVGAVMK